MNPKGRKSTDRKVILLPVWVLAAALPLFSIVSSITFSRVYLNYSADQMAIQFNQQNLSEIANGDAFALGTRLNNLSQMEQFKCVVGSMNKMIFYRLIRGDCKDSWFLAHRTLTGPAKSGIKIELSVGLPSYFIVALAAFILSQMAMVLGLTHLARRARIAQYELSLAKSEHARELWQQRLQDVESIADQFAHDVKSPLSAMGLLAQQLPSEKARELAKTAVTRIDHIAESLKHRSLVGATETHFQDAASLVRNIIIEKQTDSSVRDGRIKILIFDLSKSAVPKIPAPTLSRILSNLINNSIEAIEDRGKIEVRLSANKDQLQIEIEDEGKGLPTELLGQLNQSQARRLSVGKLTGSGLGWLHARGAIAYWKGELKISQRQQRGSKVLISLPLMS